MADDGKTDNCFGMGRKPAAVDSLAQFCHPGMMERLYTSVIYCRPTRQDGAHSLAACDKVSRTVLV